MGRQKILRGLMRYHGVKKSPGLMRLPGLEKSLWRYPGPSRSFGLRPLGLMRFPGLKKSPGLVRYPDF